MDLEGRTAQTGGYDHDALATATAAPAVPGKANGTPTMGVGTGASPVPGSGAALTGPDAAAPGVPAPGATMFLADGGLGWIALNDGGFECIQAPYARRAELHVQVTRTKDPARHARLLAASGGGTASASTAPAVPRVHVVRAGETPRMIAEQYGIAVEALLEANRDKVHEVPSAKDPTRMVKVFREHDLLIIPVPLPPGVEPTWSEWAREIAREFGDELADTVRGIVDGVKDIIERGIEWWNETPAQPEQPAAPGMRKLPAATVTTWVDRAAQTSADKKHVKDANTPQLVAQMETWLVELAADLAATDDAVQRTTLVACQFQFETTKRGTNYEWGNGRDYDIGGKFDCSEAVQWMMMNAGLGDIFGESTAAIATPYIDKIVETIFGDTFGPGPKAGDLMMWYRHVGVVAEVRPSDGIFYASHMGSSGSWFNAFDIANPDKTGEGLLGAGQWGKGFRGFWSPTAATLPGPVGTATVGTKYRANKYAVPEMDQNLALGSLYEAGQRLVLCKQTGEMWLAHREGTRGAAWVPARALIVDP